MADLSFKEMKKQHKTAGHHRPASKQSHEGAPFETTPKTLRKFAKQLQQIDDKQRLERSTEEDYFSSVFDSPWFK